MKIFDTILCRILDLLPVLHMTQKDLCDELGIRNSVFTNWKDGTTKSYTKYLYQIASILNTTPEYLRGETDDPSPEGKQKKPAMIGELSEEEQTIIQLFRSLNEEGREKLTDYADDLVASDKYNPHPASRMGEKKA